MIIYGYRDVVAGFLPLHNVECDKCTENVTLEVAYFSRHFHLFWIPVLPYKRTYSAICPACGNSIDIKTASPVIKEKFEREKAIHGLRPPIWQFAGGVIIAGLICFGIYQSEQDSNKMHEYFLAPAAGDVYHIKLDNGNYSTFRILEVLTDSVDIETNKYEVNQSSGTDDINLNENYVDQYRVDKRYFKEIDSLDQIVNIKRR